MALIAFVACFPFYIFSVVGSISYAQYDPRNWDGIGAASLTLVIALTDGVRGLQDNLTRSGFCLSNSAHADHCRKDGSMMVSKLYVVTYFFLLTSFIKWIILNICVAVITDDMSEATVAVYDDDKKHEIVNGAEDEAVLEDEDIVRASLRGEDANTDYMEKRARTAANQSSAEADQQAAECRKAAEQEEVMSILRRIERNVKATSEGLDYCKSDPKMLQLQAHNKKGN